MSVSRSPVECVTCQDSFVPSRRNYVRCDACRQSAQTQRTQDIIRRDERRAQRSLLAQQRVPCAWRSYTLQPTTAHLGSRTHECRFCYALHWNSERLSNSSIHSPQFGRCCLQGAVTLPNLPVPPEPLYTLFTEDTVNGRRFLRDIRQYNSALAFTSLRCEESRQVQGGIQMFTIHGVLYHTQGPLESETSSTSSYAQTWLYDDQMALEIRMTRNENLDRDLLNRLTIMLRQVNPYISLYKTAHEILSETGATGQSRTVAFTPQLSLVVNDGTDQRTYNLPSTSEVAMIIPDYSTYRPPRPILLSLRDNGQDRNFDYIAHTHPAYTPLHYVLFFPHGQRGWSYDMRLNDAKGLRQQKKLTQSVYHRYYIFPRSRSFNVLHHGGRLYQQYLVEAYANIDNERLLFVEHNQDTIRAEQYNGLRDALHVQDGAQTATQQFGRSIILPSTHSHSPRQYHELCQNALSLCQRFGKPTLFLTFTANPAWEEITSELHAGQMANDRPDVIVFVFYLKLKSLIKDIDDGCFGPLLAKVWTIEYQKRGLPHCHLVIWLANGDRFLDPAVVDEVISAQIPSLENDPELHRIVTSSMIHGPCGSEFPNSPCMIEDSRTGEKKCSKNFPKAFSSETSIPESGYPHYARPLNGFRFNKRLRNGTEFEVTNQWVVPYNRFLSLRYNAHINVEVCGAIDAIRYLFKYVFKGTDRTNYELSVNNEVQEYREGRYISPTQAVWEIMEFPWHAQSPSVEPLAFHVEGEHQVYWPPNATRSQIEERMTIAQSQLMAFFNYYQQNPNAPRYLYIEFPQHFVWNRQLRQWTPRTRLLRLGRLYVCSPHQRERFYLRILLMSVRGPTGFQDLRTVNGIEYPTFREACIARGLLSDGEEWFHAFRESIQLDTGYKLRNLFALALVFGGVPNPTALWNEFKESICDDLPHKLRRLNVPVVDSNYLDYGLYLIRQIIEDEFHESYEFYQLPPIERDWRFTETDVFQDETDMEEIGFSDNVNIEDLNSDQRFCFNRIVAAVNERNDDERSHFFVQGPGGTGKTFLYRCLYKHLTDAGKKVICVASSGIAALLLPFGQTAHSTFGIPLDIALESTSSISVQSSRGKALKEADFVIWDEVPMQHKYCFHVLDKLLKDLHGSTELFGGIPVLLGGDFAQILPVVKYSMDLHADTVSACLQRSFIWDHLSVLHLTQNMRLQHEGVNAEYGIWLKTISQQNVVRRNIHLPSYISIHDSVENLIQQIFPDSLLQERRNIQEQIEIFGNRIILTVRNEQIERINNSVLAKLPGLTQSYASIDTCEDDAIGTESLFNHVTPEYMSAINPPGLPPSQLHLKIGAPIMLLRNLRPKKGLCNGTRLIVTALKRHIIEAKILTGTFAGRKHYIPRIELHSQSGDTFFTLRRRQFPVRLCFAITINKSQGQSLNTVGIDLSVPVFSHGQLYVALSRVTDVRRLFIHTTTGRDVVNIVYPQVLTQITS